MGTQYQLFGSKSHLVIGSCQALSPLRYQQCSDVRLVTVLGEPLLIQVYNARNSECWKECILGQAGVGAWCYIYTYGSTSLQCPVQTRNSQQCLGSEQLLLLWVSVEEICFALLQVVWGKGLCRWPFCMRGRVLNGILVSEVGEKNALIIIYT